MKSVFCDFKENTGHANLSCKIWVPKQILWIEYGIQNIKYGTQTVMVEIVWQISPFIFNLNVLSRSWTIHLCLVIGKTEKLLRKNRLNFDTILNFYDNNLRLGLNMFLNWNEYSNYIDSMPHYQASWAVEILFLTDYYSAESKSDHSFMACNW